MFRSLEPPELMTLELNEISRKSANGKISALDLVNAGFPRI